MLGILYHHYIRNAWASALLILYQWQCESLMSGISNKQDPALLFYVSIGWNNNIKQ